MPAYGDNRERYPGLFGGDPHNATDRRIHINDIERKPGATGIREKDIQLPNPSGRVDPRIKRRTPDPLEGLRKAGEGLQKLRDRGLFGGKAK